MVVILGGIVILSRPDSLKPLIDNKVLGSSIFFRLLQPVYLQPIITQYFIDNKSEIWLLFLIAHSKR